MKEELAKEIVGKYKLGNMIKEIKKLCGGFMHEIYMIETDKQKYVVKLLNPNIMKRITALANFNRADALEKIIEENNIPAVYAYTFDNEKLQIIGDQYLYIYDYYDGKVLKDDEINQSNCEKIGSILSEIHNIDLKVKSKEPKIISIDWQYYVDLSKEMNSPVYDMIYDKLDILNDSMNRGNISSKRLPAYECICHNDMDSKNILWSNEEYKIIDLECLSYNNPYLELFSLALYWSGYESCNLNFDLFKTFIKSYFRNSKLSKDIIWEDLYYSNNGRLKWLEFNIKRSLMIDCNTEEEKEIGLKQVKETIEHVVYYDKVKDSILKAIDI